MFAGVVLTIGAGVAIADWVAIAREHRRAECVLKPLAMLLLVVVAVSWNTGGGVDGVDGAVRIAVVVGAVFGLVGDVALLGDGESAFLVGLGSFAVGHLAYAVAAVLVDFEPAAAIPGVVAMLGLLGYRFASRIAPGARAQGGPVLGGAVWFYAVVISAMVITAWATTSLVAGVGATLFAVSDWVLGHRRFAGPLPVGRLGVMVPYHVGQALLIVGLLGT